MSVMSSGIVLVIMKNLEHLEVSTEVAKNNNPKTFDEEPVKEDKKKLSKEEKIKLIEDTMNELYQLEVEGADWNKVQYLKNVLGGYHIKKDEIQKRY